LKLMNPFSLTFSLKYLNMFMKASPLCDRVELQLAPDVPLVVEFKVSDFGYIRFYLAPKIDDEANAANDMEVKQPKVEMDEDDA